MDDELLEVVDEHGRPKGLARRSDLHRDPSLLHRVVHVLVFNGQGRLLLQKRALTKDVAPGRWDTSVGGHVAPREEPEAAALRELNEELGISAETLTFLYTYLFSNNQESELVSTYACEHEGPFAFNVAEIDEVRFWKIGEIEERIGSGILSDHFEREFAAYNASRRQTPRSSGP